MPEIVGLIPAAGFGNRLPGKGGSKEVLPAWNGQPVIQCALDGMTKGGANRVVIVLRPEKQDIVDTLGSRYGEAELQYQFTGPTHGPALTLDQAWPIMCDSIVLLGFPDIVMPCTDPYSPLVAALQDSHADVAVGLFPKSARQQADPVDWSEEDGKVQRILPKTAVHPTSWRWGVAAWRPSFSTFLHQEAAGIETAQPHEAPEWSVGVMLNRALEQGLHVVGVPVSKAPFLDTGTPEGLGWAMEGRSSPPP